MAIWIQTLAISLSAVAAIWLVLSSRAQSKRSATVSMLLTMRLDSDYIMVRNKLAELIDKEDNLGKYASKELINSENAAIILQALRFHEYAATGVFEGAFDECVYKRMTCSVVIRDWNRLEGFISELRSSQCRSTLFQEFEVLAKKWKKDPLKNHH